MSINHYIVLDFDHEDLVIDWVSSGGKVCVFSFKASTLVASRGFDA